MRLILPEAWIAQPWRNGGGVTHELLREGPLEGFHHRVSVADVATDGPFSRFAGIERAIALLEGRGFVLRFADGRVVALSRPLEPFTFSGDDAVHCALIDGPVRDLNVMVDRTRARLELERHGARGEVLLPTSGARLLVFVLAGALETLAGRAPGHALVALEPTEVALAAHAAPGTELLLARIRDVPPP